MHADNCMADLVNICVHVDCTAINNQVNNIPSLPSGPCIQWGGGGGGGGGGCNCTRLHPPWLRALCQVELEILIVKFTFYTPCSSESMYEL